MAFIPPLSRMNYLAVGIAIMIAGSATGFVNGRHATAEPIGLIERYALAEDREVVLAELIPGSVESYYYHCLHYQVTGRLELAEARLREWENDSAANGSSWLNMIRDRQRLLTYGSSPDRTIEYLRSRLNLQLAHTPRPVRGQRQYVDALPADRLEVDPLIDEALRGDRQLTKAGLRRLGERFLDQNQNVTGLPVDLAWLLNQVDGPWMPRLDELVVRELNVRRVQDRRFGELTAHLWLTDEQLDNVAAGVPVVATNDIFIREKLLRMRANDDTDVSQQPAVRHAYLQRVDAYVTTLPPAWNSLKAATLYRLLESDLAAGRPDRERFVRYLNLPRNSAIVFSAVLRSGQPQANLSQDFTEIALISPIVDESELVRTYLEIFLRDADSPEAFATLIRADYLNEVFAETKLLAGVGQPDQWYRLLSPARQQQLKDRVEMTLAPTNPRYQNPSKDENSEATELIVDVKNVSELVVRIFEINTASYYLANDRPLNTDMDLDGLVSSEEQRIQYKQPSVLRHRETIPLPSISGRGVWIVDLLGGGQRTRAMIRRGELTTVSHPTVDGRQFTLLDENRDVVPGGRMLIRSQEFIADDQGRITLPMTDQTQTTRVIVMDDQIAQPVSFESQSEDYSLAVGMLLPEQQLLPGRTAKLAIRPSLRLGGQPIALSILEDAALTLTLTDAEGVQSTKRFNDLMFNEREETAAEFRVIPRLQNVTAILSGRVRTIATNRFVDLEVRQTWNVNGANKSAATMDAYLTRDGDDWVIEVRGKNGEAIDGAVVSLSLQPQVRATRIEQRLQTDANGRITLGSLPGIVRIGYQVGGGQPNERELDVNRAEWPARVHGLVDQPQRLSLDDDSLQADAPESNRSVEIGQQFRLFELRGDRPLNDLTDQLKVIEGRLVFQPTVAGNFRLIDTRLDREVSIAITAGQRIADTAVGDVRQLEMPRRDPLGITSIVRDDEGLHIKLSGDAPAVRVHVLATRYLPRTSAMSMLALPSPPLPQSRWMTLAENGYVSGMRLGEEYQYVLRRQTAAKYPGVMLPQPSLLLNPWETESTTNSTSTAATGDQPPAAPMADERSRQVQLGRAGDGSGSDASSPTYDFLKSGGGLALNLTPDENGQIHVPAETIARWAIVQIVVSDPASQIQRTVFGSLSELDARDLRLDQSLQPDRGLAFQRGVLVASPDQPLDLGKIGSAQLQVYASIDDLFDLYSTLCADPRLAEFRDLANWNELDEASKGDAYGRLACHETHVFLRMHDRAFFDNVVRPYLENKKDKQLVDAWLLGSDLSPWTQPWRYATLNSFERALLARELNDDQHSEFRKSILRELRERVSLIKVNPEVLRRAIESGLLSKRADGLSFADRQANEPQSSSGKDRLSYDSDSAFNFSNRKSLDALNAPGASEKKEKFFGRDKRTMGESRGNADNFNGREIARRSARQFFQHLDPTKQWAESNWHQVRVSQAGEDLIPLDPFWLDWANGADDDLSEHLLQPTTTRHSALIALAMCGLPLQAGEVGLPAEKEGRYQPEHAVAVVTKRLIELEPGDDDAGVLIGQRFEALGVAPDNQDDVEIRIAPEEFVTLTAYLGQVVVTNPTPQPRTVELLWQIPEGSIALQGGLATDNATLRLEPFAVERREYRFYFPQAGDFEHYPVCASHDGRVIARGPERIFHVVETPTQTDGETWEAIALDGSVEQIKAFLSDHNLHQLHLQEVLPRMKDRAVYDVVTAAIESARIEAPELRAYSVLHRDLSGMKVYLSSRQDLTGSVGPVLHCDLLDVEPIERTTYEHLEYAPLVNARVHSLRESPEILNDRFLVQYKNWMRVLAFQSQPSPEHQLALCYYLLIQNRIEEAIERFELVGGDATDLQLQRDYLSAYLAMHRGDVESATKVADRYTDHPVPRWRQRFDELAIQLDQVRHLDTGNPLASDTRNPESEGVDAGAADLAAIDRDRRQASQSQEQPSVRVVIDGDQLRITHRNAKRATINYFGVDLELLFSKAPFVRDDLGRMAMVRPTASQTVELTGEGVTSHRVEPALADQTLLIEVTSGAARGTTLLYGGRLNTYVSEGFGQLQVSDAGTRQPVRGAYVKVYAKSDDDEVQFYKDGYTDLRGRFDYATLSAPELSHVVRFAIMVLDPNRGATLHEVAPPTR